MSDGFQWFRYLWPHHVGIPVMGRCMYITLVSLALRDYRESLGEKNRKKKTFSEYDWRSEEDKQYLPKRAFWLAGLRDLGLLSISFSYY